MTQSHPPWPIALVTGFLGSGKTTLIARLLRHPDMADTVVIVNEFGEVGLDHHLIRAATDNIILLPNGCLCCMIRQDIVQTLRDLRRSWLAGTMPDFGRVIIETTGLAEPAPLVASIGAHPLLEESFALHGITTLVDAEYGLAQMARHRTSRNQICLADHLIISKTDLAPPDAAVALRAQLAILNPLATIGHGDRLDRPDQLFRRMAAKPRPSALWCDDDHLAGISKLLLQPQRPLDWTAFKIWLNTVLETRGATLLRLKGRLSFAGHAAPVIIQAVHHSFYPMAEAAPGEAFLVLIFEGPTPSGLAQGFEGCQAADKLAGHHRAGADHEA